MLAFTACPIGTHSSLKNAVVVVDPPGWPPAGSTKAKRERADAEPRRRKLDGLAGWSRRPQSGGCGRCTNRLRHHVATGHLEILALEAGIGVHRQQVGALLDRLAPGRALDGHRHAVAAELGPGRAFAGAPFDAAVGNQVERRDALGDAGWMIVAGRHQHDAVAQPDLLGALRTGGEEDLGSRRVGVFLREVVLDLPDVVRSPACRPDLPGLVRPGTASVRGPSVHGRGNWCS